MSTGFLDTGVDTAGFLAGLLTGYEPTAILREQAQNADDACHKAGVPGWLRISFRPTRLTIENPSVLSDDDWRRLAKTSSRGKAKDAEQTGEFGVGFWSVLHLTDAPAITSGRLAARIDQLNGKQAELREMTEALAGTRFELELRTSPTEASSQLEVQAVTPALLDELEQSFEEQIPELLLFAKSLTRIELNLRDGSNVVGERHTASASGAVETVTVTVTTAGGATRTTFLCLRGVVPDAPEGRSADVAVAFPVDGDSDLAGHIFCTFPTETATGLPFSINAHFYAAMDRRSIAQVGPHGDWNDRVFTEAGRLVGSNLEDLFASPGPTFEERLHWFVRRHGAVPEISRRRDFCLAAIDERAVDAAIIRDRTGTSRRGRDLVLLDATADQLLGTEIAQSVERPGDPDLVDLYSRWGVLEWRRSDVARWIADNAPAPGTSLASAPVFMSTVASLKRLLDYCTPVSAELGSACLALGTDDRLYALGTDDLPRPAGRLETLVAGLSTPVLHPELRRTVAWQRAPNTTTGWFRLALMAESANVVGKTAQINTIACFRSLSTVEEALAVFVEAQQALDGLPLAVDADRRIQAFDESVVVGLPSGAHRPAAERLLVRLGLRPLHEKIDDARLAGGDVRRLTHRVLVDAVTVGTSDAWSSIADTGDLLATCSLLLDAHVLDRADLEPLTRLAIWPAASGDTVPLGDLRLPASDRVVRVDQRDRVLSPDLCDPRSEAGRLARRVLEDAFDRVPLDAAEEAVVALEHPPSDPADLYPAIDDLLDHWRSLRSSQKNRLRTASFVPCADRKLRQPADVLVVREPLPLDLGRRRIDDRFREDRRLADVLVELGARRAPTIEELTQLAEEISTEVVTRSDDPAQLLWRFLDFHTDTYSQEELSRLGRIAWLPSDPGHTRRRPADLVVPPLAFAQLLFPVPVGVGNPGGRLRDGLGIRAALSVDDLAALATAAAEQDVRLDEAYFAALELRAANDADASRIGSLRTVSFLPVANGLRAPQELVSPKAGEIWGHLKTPIDQAFVVKYPRLSATWGMSDGEESDWRDHLDVLNVLATQAELSAPDVRLARRRMTAIADALVAGDLHADVLSNRRCVLTTNGKILRPEEALRPDVPNSVLDHISTQVPVADITSSEIAAFIDRLPVRSLRAAVDLEPIVEGTSQEAAWRTRLAMHQRNVLRFLRHVRAALPDDWVDSWPPVVESVRSLRVRAFYGARQVAEWEDSCFLAERNGVLTLSIKGATTTARSIVDAIATLYGIEAGHKTLLVQVLQATTESDGEEALDYDEIPQLRHDDPWVDVEPAAVDLDLSGQTSSPDPEPARVELGTDDPPQVSADAPEARLEAPDEAFTFETEPEEVAEDRPEAEANVLDRSDDPTVDPDVDGGAVAGPLQPPRVPTDWDALGDTYDIEEIWEPPVEEIDLGQEDQPEADDEGPRRKCILSFYDWDNGLLPLRQRDSRVLAGPGGVQSVTIFGRELRAHQIDDRSVAIDGGRELYLDNEIVPGTVIHLRPGLPGRIELHVNEDLHEVTDVWVLEVDDDGTLHRERLESVTVRWEADGPLYRCERRWEDLEALHAEATESALDLIIKVFENFGDDGLTLDEVWSLVALNRLFAVATIRSELYRQDALFTNENGTWRLSGGTVKRYRGGGSTRSGTARAVEAKAPATAQTVDERILRVARQLRDLLRDSSDELRHQVGQVLGLRVVAMQDGRAFELAVAQFLEQPDDHLLAAIRRDLSRHPELSSVAVSVLEGAPAVDPNVASLVLDLIVEFGVAGAVGRAKVVRAQILIPADVEGGDIDIVTRAEIACARASESRLTWAAAQGAVAEAYRTCCAAPYDEPKYALDDVVRLERLLRRHDPLATSVVDEARALCVARVDSAVGDTDAHGDVDRQALLATIRVLSGDAPSTLDVLNEYAKLLERVAGTAGDGTALFKVADLFAREAHVKNAAARFAAKRVAAEPEQSATISPRTRQFIDLWCEMAQLRPPT
jgi:hypothetical protein